VYSLAGDVTNGKPNQRVETAHNHGQLCYGTMQQQRSRRRIKFIKLQSDNLTTAKSPRAGK